MTKKLFHFILASMLLVLAGCENKDTYSISIEIPTSIADNMKSKKHLVFMSDHFDRTATPAYKKISNGKVVFEDLERTSSDKLIDITIGNYTFQLVPDTIGDISIKFIDSYKYIVEKGSEETNFIAIYSNYYHDTRKNLEKKMHYPKELESICESYKAYTDSIISRTPFSQWAYLHVAEQSGAIMIYNFDNNIDDRSILLKVAKAWKARNDESEQFRLLQKLAGPFSAK